MLDAVNAAHTGMATFLHEIEIEIVIIQLVQFPQGVHGPCAMTYITAASLYDQTVFLLADSHELTDYFDVTVRDADPMCAMCAMPFVK